MIEQHEIARLERTPIEDVAERLGLHVNRHKALCPFHDDSHPSLTFNTLTNRYRCYVCDAHGGVIDLVRQVRGCGFLDALKWLDGTSSIVTDVIRRSSFPAPRKRAEIKPDLEWLSTLVQPRILNDAARHFLFEERHLDERVIAWCGLSSIAWPAPCWRYGKPFYDAPIATHPVLRHRRSPDECTESLSRNGRQTPFQVPARLQLPYLWLADPPILATGGRPLDNRRLF